MRLETDIVTKSLWSTFVDWYLAPARLNVLAGKRLVEDKLNKLIRGWRRGRRRAAGIPKTLGGHNRHRLRLCAAMRQGE